MPIVPVTQALYASFGDILTLPEYFDEKYKLLSKRIKETKKKLRHFSRVSDFYFDRMLLTSKSYHFLASTTLINYFKLNTQFLVDNKIKAAWLKTKVGSIIGAKAFPPFVHLYCRQGESLDLVDKKNCLPLYISQLPPNKRNSLDWCLKT